MSDHDWRSSLFFRIFEALRGAVEDEYPVAAGTETMIGHALHRLRSAGDRGQAEALGLVSVEVARLQHALRAGNREAGREIRRALGRRLQAWLREARMWPDDGARVPPVAANVRDCRSLANSLPLPSCGSISTPISIPR